MSQHSFRAVETYIVVEGEGYFPIDMLRYDTCYPAAELESSKIVGRYDEPLRRVVLARRHIGTRCGKERWQSFGWKLLGEFNELYKAQELLRTETVK